MYKRWRWASTSKIQSATKYLNGHSDIVAGVVAGRADLVRRVHARSEECQEGK
ncbi:MAG: PLP-dependent transferase [Candidatus Poribacteria bacterium]